MPREVRCSSFGRWGCWLSHLQYTIGVFGVWVCDNNHVHDAATTPTQTNKKKKKKLSHRKWDAVDPARLLTPLAPCVLAPASGPDAYVFPLILWRVHLWQKTIDWPLSKAGVKHFSLQRARLLQTISSDCLPIHKRTHTHPYHHHHNSTAPLIARTLARLGRTRDHLSLWLDGDREGEAIAAEVVRVVAEGREPGSVGQKKKKKCNAFNTPVIVLFGGSQSAQAILTDCFNIR
jgi:hypothetical protein